MGYRINSTVKFMTFAMLIVAAISNGTSDAQAGVKSKPSLSVQGMNYYDKAQAKSSAIGRWEKKAAIKYGLEFSQWGKAKSKGTTCKKKFHRNNGRILWTCTASGRPTAKIVTCKGSVSATGTHKSNRSKARSTARENWEKKAAIAHGIKFSFWKNASQKKGFCIKKASGGTHQIRCTYIAKACH